MHAPIERCDQRATYDLALTGYKDQQLVDRFSVTINVKPFSFSAINVFSGVLSPKCPLGLP